jgi:protein-disulfide isomerase
VDISRRNLLIGTATVVIAAAAGGGYYAWSQSRSPATPAPTAPGATLPSGAAAELMEPGPLGEQAIGNANAPVTIIEYASMTCPHCAQFHEQVYPELKKKYVDTGKVRFIFREFPLDALATSAFMLARCMPEDRYFPVVDILFRQQQNWAFVDDPATALFNVVKQAGFTQESFRACLTNQNILDGVNSVKDRGSNELGVASTPTFFINGKKMSGALSLEDMDKEIEPLL